MKTLLTLCCLLAAVSLVLQQRDLAGQKKEAEAKLAGLTEEMEVAQGILRNANDQIAQLSGPVPQPSPTPKPNWVDERNRNWQSKLNR